MARAPSCLARSILFPKISRHPINLWDFVPIPQPVCVRTNNRHARACPSRDSGCLDTRLTCERSHIFLAIRNVSCWRVVKPSIVQSCCRRHRHALDPLGYSFPQGLAHSPWTCTRFLASMWHTQLCRCHRRESYSDQKSFKNQPGVSKSERVPLNRFATRCGERLLHTRLRCGMGWVCI